MLDPRAVHAWRVKQHQLLRDTYRQAWETGVASYQPDADPPKGQELPDEPGHPDVIAKVGLGVAALLLAARHRVYKPPADPDPETMGQAIARASESVERIAGELATLAPTQAQIDATAAAVEAGDVAFEHANADALSNALAAYLDSNQWRLDLAESVAWAGEQAGYAQAADADGQLLEWQTEDDDSVCPTCQALGELPPMPLADWPSTPGDGTTDCVANCRCSLNATSQLEEGDTLYPLSDTDQRTLATVAQRASDQSVPDLAALA